jgi:hypothetical protein
MIEAAFILPLLLLVVIGGLILGLATIDDMRLERATADAAAPNISEVQARRLVRQVGGTVTCWWRGTGPGGCFRDGLVIQQLERTQIVSQGRQWCYPTGCVTPSARAVVPTGG